jgi:hypothetical protein
MLRIWINANDRPCEPAFIFPKFGIQKNLYTIAGFELLCHVALLAAAHPKYQTDPNYDQNAAIDHPLRITSHETAGQNINSLEEENTTCKDQHYTEDIKRNFHENFLYWPGMFDDYTLRKHKARRRSQAAERALLTKFNALVVKYRTPVPFLVCHSEDALCPKSLQPQL